MGCLVLMVLPAFGMIIPMVAQPCHLVDTGGTISGAPNGGDAMVLLE
jgi:hypothetical protein